MSIAQAMCTSFKAEILDLIYNSSNSNKAIAVLAFGGDFTVAGGTFQIVLPAAGASGIIRID